MPSIHQFVAGFTRYDAISNEAVLFRDLFRQRGFRSAIFSAGRHINKKWRDEVQEAAVYAASASPDDLVLLHLSIGSTVNDVFRTLPCRKAILYHNITPPSYFDLINIQTATHLRRGLQQTASLAGVAAVNMADSRFNAGELEALGYRDVRVLPIVLNVETPPADVDRRIVESLDDGRRHILFVGRCTPNKRIEDLIRVFAYYQKTVEPRSRFIHVGSAAGAERYHALLAAMVANLGLEQFVFAGSVPQPELNAYYQCADAFLCMSEHEGFCIPLLESMSHGVPVVAHASAAIPETLDGSGVLLAERRFDLAAEALGRVVGDPALRAAVVAGQNERLQRYRSRHLADELMTHLAPVLPRHD